MGIFGDLFKSDDERRIERDMKIRKGMAEIKRHIRELEKNEKSWIKKGKRAKQLGDDHQLRLIKQTLKKTMAQRKLIERQLLQLEVVNQMKSQAEAHAAFAGSLNEVSAGIADMFNQADLVNTQKNIQTALHKAESMEQQMDMVLDMMEASVETGDVSYAGQDLVNDQEIDELISEQVALEEGSSIDAEIESGLSEIEKELGGG